jgi:hypothetical protein
VYTHILSSYGVDGCRYGCGNVYLYCQCTSSIHKQPYWCLAGLGNTRKPIVVPREYIEKDLKNRRMTND